MVHDFPRTGNGKPIRARLAIELGTELESRSEQSAQADEDISDLVLPIAEIWRDALGLDEAPGEDDDWLELGGTSIEAAEVTAKVQLATGRKARERDLQNAHSLRSYVRYLYSEATSLRESGGK